MKIDTRKLEKEIEELEKTAKYLYHAYEEDGLASDFDDVSREAAKKRELLEALRRVQNEGDSNIR